MSNGSGGGFDVKTLLSAAALVVAVGGVFYTSTVDSRDAVSDLEGSVRSLTSNINERPDAEAVRAIVTETVQVPTTEDIQALIDAPVKGVREDLDTLREAMGALITEEDARAIAARGDEALADERLPGLIAANAIPSGAVVAFATSCPTDLGWREYEPARGRFLVAVGDHEDANGNYRDFVPGVGVNDGEYNHTLTEDEMPMHQHTVERQGPTRGIRDVPPLGSDGAIIATIEPELTHPAGGGRPHNNVPPYIALHFCEKV